MCSRKILRSRWLWLAAFVAVWCSLRLFWITCDSGVPATWEYGFHTTDEGYYLSGGKEMLLWGSFVDIARREVLNYCYSYGTQWLSYLAHLAFGLSTWAWRLPFVVLYFAAWMLTFCHVSKRSGSAFAFAACAAVSSLPLVVTYERCASNDALIAALLAMSYALACGRGVWRIFAAAFTTSAIATVKPSVWLMIPMVLGGILEERKTRSRLVDAAAFVGLSVAGVFAWKGLSALTVLSEAERTGMSPWKVLLSVNATYGLPSITDILMDLRALASFPRDPSIRIMGATTVLISVVPASMFLVNVFRRKWNGHLLLYGSMALYTYSLNLINSMYSHYFLPLLAMLPAMFSAIQKDFYDLRDSHVPWKWLATTLALAAAGLSVGVLLLSSAGFDIMQAGELYSRIHNLPQKNPWLMSWHVVALATLAGVAAVAARRGVGSLVREGWIWGVAFFLASSAAFAALPAAVIAPRLRLAPELFYMPLGLNLVVGFLFAYLLFTCPEVFAKGRFLATALLLPVLASYLLLPTWRSAAVQLVTKRTFHDRDLARELSRLVPSDAVVIGERSNQALISLPVRTASLFNYNSNPIPLIESLRARDPEVKIYGLLDSQHAYCLQHFQKHADKYRLNLVKTFKMPSFASGSLADVYLCRIEPVDKARK